MKYWFDYYHNPLVQKYCLLLLFQIILGHENSEPRVTQLRVQFTHVLSAFQAHAMSRYFGLLIGTVLRTCRCPVLATLVDIR